MSSQGDLIVLGAGKATIEDFWTADFGEFRKKVKPCFGPLERLALEEPQIFGHHVLSHGFMEYIGITDIGGKIKAEISGSEEKFHSVMQGPSTELKKQYDLQYNAKLKEKFVEWANANVLNHILSKYDNAVHEGYKKSVWPAILEIGWQEYLDD